MSDYQPEVGHRVRTTSIREGTVLAIDPCGEGDGSARFTIEDEHGRYHGRVDAPGLTVERLPDPEPTWQTGDVVSFSTGGWTHIAMRGRDAWVDPLNREVPRWSDLTIIHAWRTNRLTHLFRDSKPVQP